MILQQRSKFRQKTFLRLWQLYAMVLPAVVLLAIFSYYPMYGVILAFKDFKILKGIMDSPWVGIKYFEQAFNDSYFWMTFRNSLIISSYKLFFGFPVPIVFALLLNELRSSTFRRFTQTVAYLPHFMSWVILGAIFVSVFSLNGPINVILSFFGIDPILFMGDKKVFRGVLVVTDIWKGFGYGSVIYLAAISGVDPQLYESSRIEGANRLQNAWYITIPSVLPVISINLILSLSGILNAGFDQIFNLYNDAVMPVADIIDTYVYRKGLREMQYSYSTAIGLFKSIISLSMIGVTNTLVKRLSGKENALW
ncbi:MAG: ABC transporter permease [Christensenellales bacterium]|jgi:putative aldouronate transport system permease protein